MYVAWGRVAHTPCQRALYTPIQMGGAPHALALQGMGWEDTFPQVKKSLGKVYHPSLTHDQPSRLKIAKNLNILCIMVKNHRKTVGIMYNG
jgi:hypothetical protein